MAKGKLARVWIPILINTLQTHLSSINSKVKLFTIASSPVLLECRYKLNNSFQVSWMFQQLKTAFRYSGLKFIVIFLPGDFAILMKQKKVHLPHCTPPLCLFVNSGNTINESFQWTDVILCQRKLMEESTWREK